MLQFALFVSGKDRERDNDGVTVRVQWPMVPVKDLMVVVEEEGLNKSWREVWWWSWVEEVVV